MRCDVQDPLFTFLSSTRVSLRKTTTYRMYTVEKKLHNARTNRRYFWRSRLNFRRSFCLLGVCPSDFPKGPRLRTFVGGPNFSNPVPGDHREHPGHCSVCGTRLVLPRTDPSVRRTHSTESVVIKEREEEHEVWFIPLSMDGW